MIKRTVLLGIMACGLFIFSGCSDDSTGMREGDPDDEAYLAAQANLDSSITEFNIDLIEAVDSLFTFNGNYKFCAPDTIYYDSTEGWHIRRWVWYMDDFLLISVIDSFRFRDINGDYQRCRDENTNEFERRLKKQISYSTGTNDGTAWEKERIRNMYWVGLTDSLTTLNGDIYRYYNGSSAYRNFEHAVEGEFQDVVFQTFDIMDGRPTYPIDGIFEGSFSTDKQLPDRAVHIEGEFTVTFYFDHYHVHLVSGDNYWDWDVYHFL